MADQEQQNVVAAEDATSRTVDEYMTIIDYFGASTDRDQVDLAVAKLNGPHSKRVNSRSTKLYFVLEGQLRGDVGGVTFIAEQNAAVRVLPGVPAFLEGSHARLLIICAPPFSPEDESAA